MTLYTNFPSKQQHHPQLFLSSPPPKINCSMMHPPPPVAVIAGDNVNDINSLLADALQSPEFSSSAQVLLQSMNHLNAHPPAPSSLASAPAPPHFDSGQQQQLQPQLQASINSISILPMSDAPAPALNPGQQQQQSQHQLQAGINTISILPDFDLNNLTPQQQLQLQLTSMLPNGPTAPVAATTQQQQQQFEPITLNNHSNVVSNSENDNGCVQQQVNNGLNDFEPSDFRTVQPQQQQQQQHVERTAGGESY